MKQEFENLLQSKSQKEISLLTELENIKEMQERTIKELEKAKKDINSIEKLKYSLEEEVSLQH